MYKNDDFGILIEKVVLLTDELANKECKKLIQETYTNEDLQQISNYLLTRNFKGISLVKETIWIKKDF